MEASSATRCHPCRTPSPSSVASWTARPTGPSSPEFHYHIASNQRKIELLLPAAEYPRFVFRAVADRRYALELGLGRLRELERWIQRYYSESGEPALRTEQPSSGVVGKVYALKAEVGNILLLARGTLDTIATLLHFLYGPRSPRFASFAAFITHLNKRYAAGADNDPALRTYIEEHLEWFRILRESYDYAAPGRGESRPARGDDPDDDLVVALVEGDADGLLR